MVVMITSEEYKELVLKANKYDEIQKEKAKKEPKHMKENITVKQVSKEEMGQVLDDLKNKVLGGKLNDN